MVEAVVGLETDQVGTVQTLIEQAPEVVTGSSAELKKPIEFKRRPLHDSMTDLRKFDAILEYQRGYAPFDTSIG